MKDSTNIKQKLRIIKNNNLNLLYIWNEQRRIKESRMYHKQTDEEYIKRVYKEKMGFDCNLKDPRRFSEKLNWLKLYYRDSLMIQCADKYAVRDYVAPICGSEILNPLIAVYDSTEQIDLSELPDQFVLKGTHGSGWNIICKDKTKFPIKKWKRIMNSWLKQNIYYTGREWVYNSIPHRIICEEYIDTHGEDLKDYKFFCFNGIPQFIQVDGERFVNHKRAFYSLNWEKLSFQYAGYAMDYYADRPILLAEMTEVARSLSNPFPFSRIDLYNVGKRMIFGEITFFPDAGFASFDPDDYDFKIGDMLKLPERRLQNA